MKRYTLFYSWQSDKPEVRKIIRKAIDDAVRRLKGDGYDIHVDQDTRNSIGTQNIGTAVLEKIRQSDVFFADLTPVTSYESNGSVKLVPNSNVMFEYGYAKGTIGMSRCILLSRLIEGQKEQQLPFDINHDSITTFLDSLNITFLSNRIKMVLEDVEKDRADSQKRFGCSLLFQNNDNTITIHPEFNLIFYGPKDAAISDADIEYSDVWTDREIPPFPISIGGSTTPHISEEMNLSLSEIALCFINTGKEPLDNCEISLSTNDNLVYFSRYNIHRAGLLDVTSIYDMMDVDRDHVEYKLNDVNPGAKKALDSFYIYANPLLSTITFTWKMTSKHYSQEGVLSINNEPAIHKLREITEDKVRIEIEDYIISK